MCRQYQNTAISRHKIWVYQAKSCARYQRICMVFRIKAWKIGYKNRCLMFKFLHSCYANLRAHPCDHTWPLEGTPKVYNMRPQANLWVLLKNHQLNQIVYGWPTQQHNPIRIWELCIGKVSMACLIWIYINVSIENFENILNRLVVFP